MKLCEYGCGQKAKYKLKNGKWCCSESFNSCPVNRKKNSTKMKELHKDPNSKFNLPECKEKQINTMKKLHKDLNSIYNSFEYKSKKSKSQKLTIEKIKKKYPFFSKIEEMRYDPDKPEEIQFHCKNHECKNSKEKDGWFTPPTIKQFTDRKDLLENEGIDGSCFYCSQHCKDTCFLYNLRGDPYRDTTKPYTPGEQYIFNQFILERDDEICHYCGEHANIVHHLRPQKLEPFFALDPDYAVSCCEKCHYKHGHPTGSEHSTGNLAKIVCSVESQKFLNQSLEDI